MKSAIFAVALLAGGAAIAQDYPADEPDPALTEPVTTTTASMPMPATTVATGGQVVLPSNADPEHDARGIAVISDPAIAPPGFNQTPSALTGTGGPLLDATGAPAVEPATETYPACTATITDNCLQAYERGRSPQ